MQKRTEIIPAIAAHFILRASNHSVDYVVNEIRPAPLPNSERGREGRVFAYSIFAMFECYMYVALPEQFACERMRSDERMQAAICRGAATCRCTEVASHFEWQGTAVKEGSSTYM